MVIETTKSDTMRGHLTMVALIDLRNSRFTLPIKYVSHNRQMIRLLLKADLIVYEVDPSRPGG